MPKELEEGHLVEMITRRGNEEYLELPTNVRKYDRMGWDCVAVHGGPPSRRVVPRDGKRILAEAGQGRDLVRKWTELARVCAQRVKLILQDGLKLFGSR